MVLSLCDIKDLKMNSSSRYLVSMKPKHIFLYILFLIPIVTLICIKNYAYYWDGVDVAYFMQNPHQPKLFHQHHLLYAPFCYLINIFLIKLGFVFESIDMLVIINIIAGLVFMGSCFYIFRKIFPDSLAIALAGVLIIGVSYTFGTYFRNANPYIISIALISFSCARMTFFIMHKKKLRVTNADWIVLFLATIIHQASMLYLPAFIYAQVKSDTNVCYKAIAHKLRIFFAMLLGLYILVYLLTSSSPSLESFFNWIIEYAKSEFRVLSEINQSEPLVGRWLLYSIYSHKTLFVAPVTRSVLHLQDYATVNMDVLALKAIGWIIFSLIIYFVIYGIFEMARSRKNSSLLIYIILWIIPYLILLMYFAPYCSFHRLFYLIPLVVFLLNGVKVFARRKIFKVAISILLIIYICYNYHCGFVPENKKENNTFLSTALIAKQYATDRNLFIFKDEDYIYAKYMRYFGKKDVAWIRQYSFERNPETSFENIYPACKETSSWLGNNYDSIYISVEYAIDNACLYNLILTTEVQNKPQCMVMFTQQIQHVSMIEFGDKRFLKVKINDFEPISYKKEITGSQVSY